MQRCPAVIFFTKLFWVHPSQPSQCKSLTELWIYAIKQTLHLSFAGSRFSCNGDCGWIRHWNSQLRSHVDAVNPLTLRNMVVLFQQQVTACWWGHCYFRRHAEIDILHCFEAWKEHLSLWKPNVVMTSPESFGGPWKVFLIRQKHRKLKALIMIVFLIMTCLVLGWNSGVGFISSAATETKSLMPGNTFK